MNERLARLEGSFDWLKIILLIVVSVMIGGFAFLGFQASRTENKVSELSTDVATLPAKINADLRDLTRTLSEAITASKQMPPTVIVVPAPQVPTPDKKP